MGDWFRVDPEAITRYGATNSEQGYQLQRVQSAIAGVTVSSTAFGHLPNAQNLALAYQEHAQASQQNLADLVEALRSTGQGLDITAENYNEQDQAIYSSLGGGQ
jgi:hypothetical protein